MSKPLTITEGFLSQVVFESDLKILTEPTYEHPDAVFSTATFALSEAFRFLMNSMASTPGYGVAGGFDEEQVAKFKELKYSELNEEQKAVVESKGVVIGKMLEDAAFRVAIMGVAHAFEVAAQMRSENAGNKPEENTEEQASEEASQDTAGDS
jgi:hypothetical protein